MEWTGWIGFGGQDETTPRETELDAQLCAWQGWCRELRSCPGTRCTPVFPAAPSTAGPKTVLKRTQKVAQLCLTRVSPISSAWQGRSRSQETPWVGGIQLRTAPPQNQTLNLRALSQHCVNPNRSVPCPRPWGAHPNSPPPLGAEPPPNPLDPPCPSSVPSPRVLALSPEHKAQPLPEIQ